MNCRYECRHPRELNLRWRYQKAKHFRESMGSEAWKAGKRVSASMGGIVTAIAIVCAVVPTSDVHRIWLFELKIILGTVAIIGSAWLPYRGAHRTDASASF